MPPCQKPGRFTYAPGPPTGRAGASVKRIVRLSLPAIPMAGHVSSSGCAYGRSLRTANSRIPSSVAAVTRASVHQAAPDDHGRSPVRRQPAVGECSARTDEGAAAQTPQRSPRGSGEVSPSSARIATASV
jgi:hypothetical protein